MTTPIQSPKPLARKNPIIRHPAFPFQATIKLGISKGAAADGSDDVISWVVQCFFRGGASGPAMWLRRHPDTQHCARGGYPWAGHAMCTADHRSTQSAIQGSMRIAIIGCVT